MKIAPSYGNAVCYAKDAMTGLRLMNQLSDPSQREAGASAHTHVGNGVSVTTAAKLVEQPGE